MEEKILPIRVKPEVEQGLKKIAKREGIAVHRVMVNVLSLISGGLPEVTHRLLGQAEKQIRQNKKAQDLVNQQIAHYQLLRDQYSSIKSLSKSYSALIQQETAKN